jgi:hypothetical protein
MTLPFWVVNMLLVLGTPVLSVAGLYAVRRTVSPESLKEHHDVAGFILAIVGVIYAVLLAFVVLVVWERYEDARVHVEQESNGVVDVYRLAHGLEPKTRQQVRASVRLYAESVIQEEWPVMQRGSMSDQTSHTLDLLWRRCTDAKVSGDREPVVLGEVLDRMTEVSDNRRLRLLSARTGVPPAMWVVLFFGGAATISFTYFFGLEKFKTQAAMTAILAVTVGLVLYLISSLEYPFSGRLGIRPEAMEYALNRLNTIDEHEAGQM